MFINYIVNNYWAVNLASQVQADEPGYFFPETGNGY